MTDQITVLMPSIPPRSVLRNTALASIAQQTFQPAAVALCIDVERQGAPATRQRCLEMARTQWVAPLDDDDAFMPQHLGSLLGHAKATNADIVYSYFQVVGGLDPFLNPGEKESKHFLNPFNPEDPVETTVTILVKRELAMEIGYKSLDRGHDTNTGEDYRFILEAVKLGAKIEHLVERTWYWRHHGANTSGLPTKW